MGHTNTIKRSSESLATVFVNGFQAGMIRKTSHGTFNATDVDGDVTRGFDTEDEARMHILRVFLNL